MDILVVGGGGREHAICWKLSQSPLARKIYCAPGNPGISSVAECVPIPVADIASLAKFARENSIGLTVVGPEVPLCAGIADSFKEQGLKIFGPGKAAAALEGSKIFSKQFMNRNGIPTAKFNVFENKNEALSHLDANFDPRAGIVVKADGLAAGKGVIVAKTIEDARKAIESCFSGEFGDAGRKVLIEEMLLGEEASILALCDGNCIVPLASSQDHKRAGDGDSGPNTGGMGAYSPAPVVTGSLMAEIDETVLQRFLRGIQEEKLGYCGIIYAGIMVTKKGPMVLEFNVRFGDPETQAVLPRLKSDLLDAMLAAADGRLSGVNLLWDERPSVSVVMVSGGYPGSYKKGFQISGIADAQASGAIVFHAGTSLRDGKIVNSGGRVLAVTALGRDIPDAISKSYKAVSMISWEGEFHRKDIAQRALALGAPEAARPANRQTGKP